MTSLSCAGPMLVDDFNVKAQRKHLVQETVPMNWRAVADSNQHLCGQEVVDQFHDFIKRMGNGFHLSLPHQDTFRNEGAAGPRTGVNPNHEHIGR